MKRSAFTLIELLVVVAIIGALIAIITPSLGRAKESSRRAVCGSNQHQLLLATFSYAVSNRAQLPARTTAASVAPQVAWQVGTSAEGDLRGMWEGVLGGYTAEESSPMMYCPSYTEGTHSLENGWPHSRVDFTGYLWGYVYFGSYPHTGYWRSSLKSATALTDLGRTPIWGDLAEQLADGWMHAAHNTDYGTSGSDLGDQTPTAGFNTAYLDGSVQWNNYPSDNIEPAIAWSAHGAFGFWWGSRNP